MKLVLMGPQGSGKGTQAERLAEHYEIPHISVGDLLRDEIAKDTPLGKKIAITINAGKLVPHAITDKVVQQRLEQEDTGNGWILDGYPRDADQAAFLDNLDEPDFVLVIDVPEKVSIERISRRRICPKCHEVYGISVHPKKAGVCDKCGAKLVHRDDDKPDAIKKRLKIYRDETEPLVEYYKPRNIVYRFDGTKDVDAVFEEITQVLG